MKYGNFHYKNTFNCQGKEGTRETGISQSMGCSTSSSAIREEKCCRCKILRNHTEDWSPPYLMLAVLKHTETAKEESKLGDSDQTIKPQSLKKEREKKNRLSCCKEHGIKWTEFRGKIPWERSSDESPILKEKVPKSQTALTYKL